jgi:zinc transport system permease protein
VGTFLVQKRLSLMGDGIGHMAFAGVAAGLLAGVWPLWTALLAAVIGAVAIERLRARRRSSADVALAVFFYSGIAAGVVMSGLSRSLNAGVIPYLFGSILTVTVGDTALVAALGVLVLGFVALAWRALFAVVLDESGGRVAGLPVDALNLAVAVMAALIVAAAMRVVGVLLVAALMVLPVGTAQHLASSFRGALLAAAVVGASSVVLGLGLARAFGLAPGGTIVLVAAAAFFVTSLRPRTGPSAGWPRGGGT